MTLRTHENDGHLQKTNIEIKLNNSTIKETISAGQFTNFFSRFALSSLVVFSKPRSSS